MFGIADSHRPTRMGLGMNPTTGGRRARVCFVGPMVGRNPGRVTTQGQILSDLFHDAGYPVISVSSKPSRYMRLADTMYTILARRKSLDALVVEVYSGRSFVVSDIASAIGRMLGLRVIMWLHGGALPEFIARYPKWTCQVLRRADILVAPSEYLARMARSYGLRAQVIPNVIDLSAYTYRHRQTVSPRMFWMRAFHPLWNPAMAIRVLARLREVTPDASLVMAGENKGMQDEIERLAASLDVSKNVRFVGFLDMSRKVSEASAADIYINTNHVDNMPVAVVEACAMGLPVVSTSVGGIPDLLKHGETGLLVRDDDDEGMARAIQSLLNDPELSGRLSSNGRRLAERSAWSNVRSQWDRLLLHA